MREQRTRRGASAAASCADLTDLQPVRGPSELVTAVRRRTWAFGPGPSSPYVTYG